ncbi:MAG: Monofunctional biosynthetic peptidoglycan transglycosylase [Anaerolineales bacterium]|nr:Monofunctional biosynthetic peptidoglycan transglycosylase [Anaerolineales bacterium]
MTSPIETVHRRRERRADSRRHAAGRARAVWFGFGYIFSILLALAIFAFAFTYADLTRDLPSVDQLPILLDPNNGLLLQPTRVTDRTGQHTLFTFAPDDSPRAYIPLDQLPDWLIDAAIAASDANFAFHPGYIWAGLDNPDAHPTLAQKLAYELLLFDEPPSLQRALRERILAAQITARFGREKILEWTLNSANYGNYAFGIESAARLYFHKPAEELTLAESALLAGTMRTPSLNPVAAPEAAAQRANEVLLIMKALGMIEEIPSPPAPLPAGEGGGGEGTTTFLNLALAQLSARYDRTRIERGGLIIVTTLDSNLQQNALCLAQIFNARLANTTVNESGCEAARLLPALPESKITNASTSALILDPRDGQILALVGDVNPHPAGTLLTPFIYLTGFTRGLGPASLVWDIPRGDLRNPDDQFHGPMRLRAALANDYLIPAADVLEQMGAQNAVNTARSFGLDLDPGAAFASDSPPQSILDLASAYGTFAAFGLRNGQRLHDSIQASAILRVESVDGSIWLDWSSPESQSVVSPQLAYLMNDILSDNPARWQSWGNPNVTEIGRPAAFKSGRIDSSSAWAIGYTPARLAAVWTGADSSSTVSARPSASLWNALMQTASLSLTPDDWTRPAGVTEMDVCDPSGLLPTNDCPAIVKEIFLNGFEPSQPDTLFRSYAVNRETGLLATVFTPPSLVEQRVFMAVPQEARAWAASAGIPVAPEAYDAIQLQSPNPNANIVSPIMFAEVNGRVQIIGTAAGERFQYYKVQVGQGLNPTAWIEIHNTTSAAANGLLAEWDTRGLSGLYAIQLVVVYEDNRVETAIIQVIVRG